MIYFASRHDCEACALKPKCCPNAPACKIAHSIHEAARDKPAQSQRPRPTLSHVANERRSRCSSPHLKRILTLDRLRLRGPKGAKDEFLLAASAQNLRKLAKLIPLRTPVFAG